MCGRFNIITDPSAWMSALDFVRSSDDPGRFEPRYNIGPSEPPRPAGSRRATPRRITHVPIVYRRGDEFVGEDAIWPLIPVWARGEVPRYSTANARSEEMAGKNSYEVKTTNGPATTPFWITANERRVSEERPDVFRLARLYDFSRTPAAFQLKPPLTDHVRLAASQYRATF